MQEEAEATRARRTKNNAKVHLAAPCTLRHLFLSCPSFSDANLLSAPTKSKPIGGKKRKQTRIAKITEVDTNNRIMGNKTTAQARIDTAAVDEADTTQRKKDRRIISQTVRIRKPPDKTGDISQPYDGKLTSEPDRQGTNTGECPLSKLDSCPVADCKMTPVPSRSKKRSLPIVESDDEVMSDHAVAAKPVVVRKKPRLPTPSDSEDDDVSLIALARKRLQVRRLEGITQEGAAPKRPEAATKAAPNEIGGGNSLQSRVSPEADSGADTRITAPCGAKHHRSMGEQADGHTHTTRKASGEAAIEGNPQFGLAADKDNAVTEQHGSDAEQSNTKGRKGRTSRKRQADEPNNVSLNDVGRKKARPRGTVKKLVAEEDDGQEESRDDGVPPLTERPLEVIADKPLKAKRSVSWCAKQSVNRLTLFTDRKRRIVVPRSERLPRADLLYVSDQLGPRSCITHKQILLASGFRVGAIAGRGER